MRYIDCEVNDEYVIGSGVVIGASGSHNDVGLRLKFGDMWAGLNIYATFINANGEKPVSVMLMPSMLVPGEAMTYLLPISADAKKYPGKAMLTLSGFSVINGTQVDRATNTVTSFFRVLKSDYRLLTDSSVTPTLAQQLHSEVNSLGERIEESETDIADIRADMADIEDKIDKIQVPDSNIPEWALQPNKPSYSKDEVGLGNVDNVRQYSASNPPPYPVTSVNGQGGNVSLGAADVGAMPAGTKIPAKTSDITNDSGFITKAVFDLANYYTKSQTFTRDEINAKISAIPKFAISVVSSLPTSNISVTTVYLVGGGSGNDLYTEYIYANDKWEILGAQTVDLTGYATETWVNTQLGSYLKQTELDAAINTALAAAKASGAFDGKDGKDGADGYTPVRETDYWTPEDKKAIEDDAHAFITTELAKRGQLIPEYAESLEWLNANGDQSKMYVLPDGMIYAWMLTEKEVETGGGYTNLIDGTNGYIKDGYRYSASSAAFKPLTGGASIIVPVPTSGSITIRVRGMKYNPGYPTVYGGTTNTAFTNCFNDTVLTKDTYDTNGDWYFTFANTKSISYIVTTGLLTGAVADVIATVNEEIVEGGTEIITEYDWANTGLAFVPADYEGRIIDLENDVAKNKTDIENLKKGITTSTPIKDWDSPIYDANIPVFELSVEKAAMTNAPCTPSDIYAKYDALMAKHPRYIKKTDLGLCSDGVNHVYRYDFREPEPLHESNKEWSETKAKAIIVTGIHFEWAGIYAMYNALEEIADNPKLRNFRRNTHLIVVPCANPYATIVSNYQSGLSTPNSYGVRNANGVEIHRNFEVDWVLTAEGTTHYGGAAPLSEVETQYIDNIMKNNTDAAFFLSCHNCGVDTFWGTGFIWASTATKYMCNMGYRVIDKLSEAWMDKYGDTLSAGIAEYKTSALADGETRLGWTGLSTSPGTEAKQATKYGIQGTNVEICDPFQIHGTKANPEPSMSSFTMSRGAEVYANFLLTAFGVYDPKDKALYGGNQ